MIYIALVVLIGMWAWIIYEIKNAPTYKDGKFKRKRK